MIDFPKSQLPQYLNLLEKRGVPAASFAECIKWSRYYIDYCSKYPVPDSDPERVRLFVEKLKAKKQSDLQCRQAAYAVNVFLENQKENVICPQTASESPDENQCTVREPLSVLLPKPRPRKSQYTAAGYEEKSSSPQWDEVIAKMAGEIKVRHYSRRTLQTYVQWSRQFQRFLRNKNPDDLAPVDVKEYLTWLAVKCNVAASTQNEPYQVDRLKAEGKAMQNQTDK